MAIRKLKWPLVLNQNPTHQGNGLIISQTGVEFEGVSSMNNQISLPQAVGTTSNVWFTQVSASLSSGGVKVGSTNFTASADGTHIVTDGFTVEGELGITNLILTGGMTVGGSITAEEIISEVSSSTSIFKSGSTEFGDSIDDPHYITGSVYQSGSLQLQGYTIDNISNDITMADSSSTSLVTENALSTYIDNASLFVDRQEYVRSNFSKTAASVSDNTASFSAVSASAPSVMVQTSDADYLFFNNGQVMEHDGLQIQQSGSTFLLIVDPSSIGYNLVSDDEIKAWGKFNA
jgi:hypothetical protein